MPDLEHTDPPPGTPEAIEPPHTHDGTEGLLSVSFLGLLATQLLGAMNDNLFRWLAVYIGKDLVGGQHADAARTAGAALLVLPFMLLAAPAGYLADRFSKRDVIVGCKVAEVVVMILGVAAILSGNIYVLFVVVFLMGSQSALFGPSKYGSIPEIVRPDRISAANGLVGMTTIMAIILGTVTAGYLYHWTEPLGRHNWWISAAVLVGVAALGLMTSLPIARLPVANPRRRFPVNPAAETYSNLSALIANRPLVLAALGSAVFWGLGGLCQLNVERLATGDLQLMNKDAGPLLAVIALGVGLGNLLAGYFSKGKIELGIVPYGAAGIALFGILLWTVPGGAVLPDGNADYLSPAYLLAGLWLFLLGVCGGMYDVPLQAFLQYRSPEKTRGSILAACNFVTCSGIFAASGVFFVLGQFCGLSSRSIFLVLGLAIIPVVLTAVLILPQITTRVALVVMINLFYRVRLEGLENVPERGGSLVVPNHISWADGVFIGTFYPGRPRMVVYADYFETPWLGWFGRLARVIPIKPGKRSIVRSLRAARAALQSGEPVGIFPEGGISRTGKMQEFQPGLLSILKGTDAPVIPAYIKGMWGSIFSFEGGKFFWKLPRRWRYPVTIRFGKPIYRPASIEQVRDAVAALGKDDEI